jgi:hypothetical protein
MLPVLQARLRLDRDVLECGGKPSPLRPGRDTAFLGGPKSGVARNTACHRTRNP